MPLFRRKTSIAGPAFLRPLGTGRTALKSKRKEIFVGIMGLAFSVTLLTSLLLLPWRKSRHADYWQATPCLILKADVRTETQHQGYSFKADLAYAYEFGGTKHVSTQRDFTEWSGLSYANTQAAIEGFVPGTRNVCYVNPYNATQAVLRREFHVDWFITLFLFAWLILSAWLVGHGAFVLLKPVQSALPWETPRGRALAAKPSVALGVSRPPALMLSLCLAGALACLILGGWLGSEVMRSLRRGGFDLLPAVYGALCGVGVYQCVRLGRGFLHSWRNPSPRLGVRPSVLVPGKPFQVAWVWERGDRSARQFRLWLEGREEALVVTVSPGFHGKSRSEKIQKATFRNFLLADIPAQVSGTREFVVPGEIMHSFEGVCSRIVWFLKVATFDGRGTAEHEHKIVIRAPPAIKS